LRKTYKNVVFVRKLVSLPVPYFLLENLPVRRDRKGLLDRLGYQVRKNTIKPSFSSGIRRRDTRILSTDKDNTIKKK